MYNSVLVEVEPGAKAGRAHVRFRDAPGVDRVPRHVLQIVGRYAISDDVASVPIRRRLIFGKEPI
jgi:hypothetical protein